MVSNIAQIAAAGRMTEQDYDCARAELGNRKDASAKWDQQLADLFYRSGWTLEQLKSKEGSKSKSWIAYHLTFGRFLNFSTMVEIPKNLTERRFRDYWSQTSGNNERQRFAEVQKLMAADLALRAQNRPKIGKAILDKFADGKWHSVQAIAKGIDATEDHVAATFHTMLAHETYDARCERKQVGTSFSYRVFPKKKQVSSQELIEKLDPIIERLKAEGKKNMATMSPGTVAALAHELRQLLDEWIK